MKQNILSEMNSFEKNITFVIVSFKSSHIIEKCIKSINSNIRIIVVENSDDIKIKNYLENKFLNEKRDEYNSLFLTNYRESNSIARKRISFK